MKQQSRTENHQSYEEVQAAAPLSERKGIMKRQTLSEARIRYLKAAAQLDSEGKGLRSIEIARMLNVSRPSVHAMLEKLNRDGYISKTHYGIIYLTARGQEVLKNL